MAAHLVRSSWWKSGQVTVARALHLQERKGFNQTGLNFIEYNSGPCTADKIILQADKYSCSLVDCVSSDFEMDKGMAKCFNKAFQHKDLLKEKGIPVGKAAIIPYKNCYIYYLVTRERWWDRSCYRYLKSALQDVKEHSMANGITDICMGRLGSGADGLDWMTVRELIQEIFKNNDITITAQITR